MVLARAMIMVLLRATIKVFLARAMIRVRDWEPA